MWSLMSRMPVLAEARVLDLRDFLRDLAHDVAPPALGVGQVRALGREIRPPVLHARVELLLHRHPFVQQQLRLLLVTRHGGERMGTATNHAEVLGEDREFRRAAQEKIERASVVRRPGPERSPRSGAGGRAARAE